MSKRIFRNECSRLGLEYNSLVLSHFFSRQCQMLRHVAELCPAHVLQAMVSDRGLLPECHVCQLAACLTNTSARECAYSYAYLLPYPPTKCTAAQFYNLLPHLPIRIVIHIELR